jgi:sugar-specific transcriptional regulator TrmB
MGATWSTDAEEAASLLETLGFREYEARCLVALLQGDGMTAADLGDAADIPRSRVYDAADALADRELAEVSDGTPRRYRALSADVVIDQLETVFHERIDTLSDVLADLETSSDGTDPGVWQLSGLQSIRSRLREFVTEAEETLVVYVTDDLLEDEYVESLEAAQQRGVDLSVLIPSEDIRSWFDAEFPSARVTDGPDLWKQAPNGAVVAHLTFVDWDSAMMVSVTQESPADTPEYHSTLIEGVDCGFLITLRELLKTSLAEQPSSLGD